MIDPGSCSTTDYKKVIMHGVLLVSITERTICQI